MKRRSSRAAESDTETEFDGVDAADTTAPEAPEERQTPMRIVAIDFETAHRHRHSACQLAAVLVEDGDVVDILHTLLDPEAEFEALHLALHGITPARVAGAPRLVDLWPRLADMLSRADRVIAHNVA